jgi:hypothetical protein
MRKNSRVQSDYEKLLTSVFDFMRKSGFQESEVKDVCARALATATRSDASNASECAALAAAALTLDAWHRNRRYLNGMQPRAIPLLGPSPSVEALIRSQNVGVDPASFARTLKSLGLVVRSGRGHYTPSDRIALVKGLDPMIQQYVARSSAALLATIRHNTSRIGNSSRLIERFAEVPDLPKNRVAEFRRFAHSQGWAFIRTLNDWLESRRPKKAPGRAERTVRAGVHLYAYVDPMRARPPRQGIV